MILRKPWGMHVHPSPLSPGEPSVLSRLKSCRLGEFYPLHRLDWAASGLLAFALDARSASEAGRLFRERQVRKAYRVMLRGWIDGPVKVDSPVEFEGEGGDDCSTTFTPLARYRVPEPVGPYQEARFCQCRVDMEAGRRHQIRIHAAHMRHPVLGDTSHGCRHHNHLMNRLWPQGRLQLSCTDLGFVHPFTGEEIMIHDEPQFQAGWLGLELEEFRLP